MASSPYKAGKHFLQIPGPSNVPDRILRAMDYPTIDHRWPDFAKIGTACLAGMKTIFKTDSHVVIYPASGTGDPVILCLRVAGFQPCWRMMQRCQALPKVCSQ